MKIVTGIRERAGTRWSERFVTKARLPGTERMLAPGTAIKAFARMVIPSPLFDADYLKSYVDNVCAKFETTDLTFIGNPPPNSNDFVKRTTPTSFAARFVPPSVAHTNSREFNTPKARGYAYSINAENH